MPGNFVLENMLQGSEEEQSNAIEGILPYVNGIFHFRLKEKKERQKKMEKRWKTADKNELFLST